MPRLLEWNRGVIDPGSSSTQSIEEETRVYVHRAVFDIPVPEEFIYNQAQCPRYFEMFQFGNVVNRNLLVIGREIRQHSDAPNVYDVRITYSNKWSNTQNADKPNIQFQFIVDPTERPALITGGYYTIREAMPFTYGDPATTNTDKLSIPPQTTAGEPLIIEEEFQHRKWTITKNVRDLTPLMARGGKYINKDTVRIYGERYDPHTLLLFPIEYGHISVENGFFYFPITMTILHNPKTWIRKLRNAGYWMKSFNAKFKANTINPQGNPTPYYPVEPITFSNGSRPDRPVLLNKGGRPFQSVITGEAPDPNRLTATGLFVPLQANAAQAARIRKIKLYDIQSPDDFGRAFTQQEIQEAELKHRTFPFLDFMVELPLN